MELSLGVTAQRRRAGLLDVLDDELATGGLHLPHAVALRGVRVPPPQRHTGIRHGEEGG